MCIYMFIIQVDIVLTLCIICFIIGSITFMTWLLLYSLLQSILLSLL